MKLSSQQSFLSCCISERDACGFDSHQGTFLREERDLLVSRWVLDSGFLPQCKHMRVRFRGRYSEYWGLFVATNWLPVLGVTPTLQWHRWARPAFEIHGGNRLFYSSHNKKQHSISTDHLLFISLDLTMMKIRSATIINISILILQAWNIHMSHAYHYLYCSVVCRILSAYIVSANTQYFKPVISVLIYWYINTIHMNHTNHYLYCSVEC